MNAHVLQHVRHFHGELLVCRRNWHDHDLPWGQPERPLAPRVLRHDSCHTLHRPENGTVYHDWSGVVRRRVGLAHHEAAICLPFLFLFPTFSFCWLGLRLGLIPSSIGAFPMPLLLQQGAILEVEADGKLEIELDCRALVPSAQGVVHLDVYLRPVEGAIPRVDLPWLAKFVKRLLHFRLGQVPERRVSKSLLRPGGQIEIIRESQGLVHVVHEVKGVADFLLNLVPPDEAVSVVLLEAAYPREASQSTAVLVSVQHPEVGYSQGQVFERARGVLEDKTVAGTVHGLHAVQLFLNLE